MILHTIECIFEHGHVLEEPLSPVDQMLHLKRTLGGHLFSIYQGLLHPIAHKEQILKYQNSNLDQRTLKSALYNSDKFFTDFKLCSLNMISPTKLDRNKNVLESIFLLQLFQMIAVRGGIL